MRHASVVTILSALAVLLTQLPALPAHAQTNLTALWSSLGEPAFDSNQVAAVEHVELGRDAATLTLLGGMLALGRSDVTGADSPTASGRIFAAAFRGAGRLRFAPTLPMEKQQLALHSGQQELETEFTEAVFVFTDSTYDDMAPNLTFRSKDPGGLQMLYQERSRRWTRYGLNWEPRLLKALLAARPERHAFFVAELKTREYGWLTLIVDASDPEELELQQLDPGLRTVDVWSKFPAGGRRPQEVFADPVAHHEYRIEGYVLDVTIEKDTELKAEAEVNFEMKRSGERVLLLALDPNLRVTEITDAGGQPLSFFQPADPKDRFFRGAYLVVVSPEAFPVGPTTLHFRYAGKRIVRKFGAGNYFCQSFGWYPSYSMGRVSLTTNQFATRADFDITLRVLKKFQTLAVGVKVEEREEENYLVTRWQSEIPLAVAGFAFGEFKLVTQKIGNTLVEIYANKEPDDALRSPPMLGGTGRFVNPPRAGEILLALGAINPARLAPTMAAEIGNSLRVMEIYFGPYPYKKLAVTNIPYSYGQGWPSLLYISILSFLDSYQRSVFGVRDQIQLTDFFRAHETSHQWGGHAVGWKSYHDQWLSEGFAQFSGILYAMHRRKHSVYLRLLRNDREALLERDRKQMVYEKIGPIYAGRRLSSGKHPGGYPVIVYKKGGWVLHMLRMMFYDSQNPQNPDARFKAMMHDFTRTFHNQPASTEDFKGMVEKHMLPHMNFEGNGTMDWFFDSWVYGTGIPKYKLDYTIEPTPAGGFLLRGKLHQSGVPETFRMIVPLFFHQGGRKRLGGWLRARGTETPFEVTLPFKPGKITINEGEDVLATVK